MSGLSIVMPVFNSEKYLQESLVSLAMQSEYPDELIIVNDGSTDDSLKIINAFVFPFPVTIISQINKGPGLARNAGLALAKHDYVYFFDSDDKLAPDAVKRFKAVLKENPVVECVLFSGESFLDQNSVLNGFYPDYSRALPAGKADRNRIIENFYKQRRWSVNAFLYVTKRSVWKDNRLNFHQYFHEDTELFYRLLLSVNDFFVLDEVLCYRRVRASSIMTAKKNIKHLKGCVTLLLSLTEMRKSISPIEKRFISIASSLATMNYLDVSRQLNEAIQYRVVAANFFAYPSARYLVKVALAILPGVRFRKQAIDKFLSVLKSRGNQMG